MKGQTKLKSQKNIYDNEELLVKVKSSNLLDFFELDESYKENVQQHLNNQNLKTSMKTNISLQITREITNQEKVINKIQVLLYQATFKKSYWEWVTY
ncbi:hypothetical protein ABPG73_016916 [Tetrahymena malaccensis]